MTFTLDQIIYLQGMREANPYNFLDILEVQAKYGNSDVVKEVVRLHMEEDYGALSCIKDIKQVLGCSLVDAKNLFEGERGAYVAPSL